MPMQDPTHPGRDVRQDCLEARNLNVSDGARMLGVSRITLSEIVNENRGLSPEMSIRLDKAFGGGAESWYLRQARYDMAQALKHADDIKVAPAPPAGRRKGARLLSHGGKSQAVLEWAAELGVPATTIQARLRRGWKPEEALGFKERTKARRQAHDQ